jgi:hypothetical protein
VSRLRERVLADERRRGRVRLDADGRPRLVEGAFDPDVLAALRQLTPLAETVDLSGPARPASRPLPRRADSGLTPAMRHRLHSPLWNGDVPDRVRP